jgi:hypothetical protein
VGYIAAAELAIILVLVLLYHRARDHEVKAVLDVMTADTQERKELLNAARNPGLLLPLHKEEPAEFEVVDLEAARARAEAMAKVGRVEDPE